MTWRPFEQNKENIEAAEAARKEQDYATQRLESTRKRTCKLHSDCRYADEMTRAAGGRTIRIGDGMEVIVMTAKHE